MTQTQSPPEEFFWLPEGTQAVDRLVTKQDFARADFDDVRARALPITVRDEGNGQWSAAVTDENSVNLTFRDQSRDKAIAHLRKRLAGPGGAAGGDAGGDGGTGMSGAPSTPTR